MIGYLSLWIFGLSYCVGYLDNLFVGYLDGL